MDGERGRKNGGGGGVEEAQRWKGLGVDPVKLDLGVVFFNGLGSAAWWGMWGISISPYLSGVSVDFYL